MLIFQGMLKEYEKNEKNFKKGVDREVILGYTNTTASENTKQQKRKIKKLQKSVDKQNTTKYNNKGFAAQEKQTKSVWRGVRVV